MSATYEFIVSEPMVTWNEYLVEATTREEALEIVLAGGAPCATTDPYPRRPMTIRDVRRLGRVD